MVDLRVLFFASAREIVGEKEKTFHLSSPQPTVEQLVEIILQQYPRLKQLLQSMVLAVNLQYVSVNSQQLLSSEDEIAVIPPLAGG